MAEMDLIGKKSCERKFVENKEEKCMHLNMTFQCGNVGKARKRRRQLQPQGKGTYASSSSLPPWEQDDPRAKWNVLPGAYNVPRRDSTTPPPPKARPQTPRSKAMPKAAPEPPPVVKEEEWSSSAPPAEGIVTVEVFGRD